MLAGSVGGLVPGHGGNELLAMLHCTKTLLPQLSWDTHMHMLSSMT
jgi:hypothetical protein